MNRFWFLGFVILFFFFRVEAQSNLLQEDSPSEDAVTNFKPSLAVVIGILCVMFALTFILLLYAKFCHRGSSVLSYQPNEPALVRSASRFSGIDKTVIESLPFFRFSSLKGSKQGLECAVCLSKFEDIEILRLLPKCKHAFHINCIDQWLEKHSSCPLCRLKVNAEDPTIFTYSNSMRFLFNNSELRGDSNIELFIQREEDHRGSSRFSIGSSFRKTKEPNKEEQVLIQEENVDGDDDQKILHKYNHKIILSDVIFKNRWSNASSSDLMFLNSELLNDMSSNRFSTPNDVGQYSSSTTRAIENEQIMKIKEEMEIKRLFENKVSTINKTNAGPSVPDNIPSASDSNSVISSRISRTIDPGERRSASEITSFSRFQALGKKNRFREASLDGNERMRRLWLPIARRTVQWFADRERRSHQQQSQQNATQPSLDV
ncbi:E3 ubiquitin-protein like [Melia azedarach]|uniref:E3 ubiquitin-protein like n=1 Tax=Melia azedarach TaxID=155640 RepID=A0ACC1XDY1_MELAZ|nr:E3 ubiquitin-protein like [Melia azedarach]